MFPYPCPSCSQRLLASPERVGQRTICPKCLRPLTIPTAEAAAALAPDVDFTAAVPETDHALFEPPTPHPARSSVTPNSSLATRRPAPTPVAGAVLLAGPDEHDVATELTATISMRMKPPPDPPADLQLSTGAWLLLTAVGLVLWFVGFAAEPEMFSYVTIIGALLAAVGYLWAVYLAGRHDWLRGLATLVPPITIWRLVQPFGDNGYRPLRFVLTGLLLLGLAYLGPAARLGAGPIFTVLEPVRVDTPSPPSSPAERLRAVSDQKQPDALVGELLTLARPEKLKDADDDMKAETIAELKRLARHDRVEVRVAALPALALWSPAEAREPVLVALRSGEQVERKKALVLAGRWPDEEVARAVAPRLADSQEQALAEDAILAIGAPAEAALLPLLKSEDKWFLLQVIELLGKVGGPRSVEALTELSKTGPEKLREPAAQRAQALTAKLKGK